MTCLISWPWLDSQLDSIESICVEKSCENIIIVILPHLVVVSLHDATAHLVVIHVVIVKIIEFSANYSVS